MKIAFITAGLEPGRDGVGDYTTLLAAECERHGCKTVRCALNDPFVGTMKCGADSLRLPSGMEWSVREREAQRWLAAFAPDWVSVQFVAFGFQPRGFVSGLAARLRAICAGGAVHVFLHELWVGEETGASWRHRVLGWIQRRGVLRVLRTLQPRLIHTSTVSYVQRLERRGIGARELPLFGNVPLPRAVPQRTTGGLTFVMFGTLHPVWPPEPLFSQLRQIGVPIALRHVGHMGRGAELWRQMAHTYDSFTFEQLGPLPPERIAEELAAADFGIATTPWSLIGKSGSVAAMLDCGLPVVVNRDDVHFPGLPEPVAAHPLLIRMSSDLPAQLRAARRQPPRLRLPEIARQFLADWEAVRQTGAGA